jgi:hypothetical protein
VFAVEMAFYTVAETVSGFWGGFMFDGLHLSTQGAAGVMAVVGAAVTVRRAELQVFRPSFWLPQWFPCSKALLCPRCPCHLLHQGSQGWLQRFTSVGVGLTNHLGAGHFSPTVKAPLSEMLHLEACMHLSLHTVTPNSSGGLELHCPPLESQAAWSLHAWRVWQRSAVTKSNRTAVAAYERVTTQDEDDDNPV